MENKSFEDLIRVAIMSIGTAMESINTEMDSVMWTLIAFITIDYITGVDQCFVLVEGYDGRSPSAEDILLENEKEGDNMLGEQIRSSLTKTQYRRIILYYYYKFSESKIAGLEGVGQRRISTSLTLGKKKLKKIITELRKNEG